MNILNYIVKIAIIVIGILFIADVFTMEAENVATYRIMGVVFVLFGAYRLVTYYVKRKNMIDENTENNKVEDEENEK